MYQKSIVPAFEQNGKRKKMIGVLGVLTDGDTILHSKVYGSYSEAEIVLDALVFELSSAAPAEATAEPASTCCFCSGLHHPQDCNEMRALLFAPDAPGCVTCGGDGDCPDCGVYLPLDLDFAPIGFEVA